MASDYRKLAKIRHKSVHFSQIRDMSKQALTALQLIMKITDKLFGLRKDIFFWVPGEPYIKKEKEKEPIVQEFFIPNCILVGYKHSVDKIGDQFAINDENEDREITDEEFKNLRQQWRGQ